MSANAPKDPPQRIRLPSTLPVPPPRQLGTVRIEVSDLPEVREALGQAVTRIQDLESINKVQETEIKKLRKALEDANDALAAWQEVVRVAREKDSTLPGPGYLE